MEICFKENYLLENDFVLLRPLELSDYDNLLHFSINEPEIWSFNANSPTNSENLIKYIATAIEQRVKEQ